ncbi:hypothetical protein MXD61_26660 [Frankia sp. AgPm24]|nr:hypothetical protein [Frankia sp. AgPm24]
MASVTGVDGAYEPAERVEVRLDTTALTSQAAADGIVEQPRAAGIAA